MTTDLYVVKNYDSVEPWLHAIPTFLFAFTPSIRCPWRLGTVTLTLLNAFDIKVNDSLVCLVYSGSVFSVFD
jgi:hypothetical protein